MPGKRITTQQVKKFMSEIKNGTTQEIAAAKAGISLSSGKRIKKGINKPNNKEPRTWRTRKDPFESVWESEIVPQLKEKPNLSPITLFEDLQDRHPGCFSIKTKRTFQRKVKQWKALNGPGKEVMFRQKHVPGQQCLSDFTELNDIKITLSGQSFPHRLYHFRLAYSGWRYVHVIEGGESFTALAESLQEALWRLGGAPLEHRTDSLSAAYKNMSKNERTDLTQRYEQLCQHYGIKPTRNNRGESHENGSIESPHGHLKRRIRQGLLLRDSHDFDSIIEYKSWIDSIVQRLNNQRKDLINEERKHLQPLPAFRTTDYTEKVVQVTTSSTIDVKRVLYTVPSRLIGERLRLHIFDNRIDVYVGSVKNLSLPRIYPKKGTNNRARSINYHHIIDWLVRKPQAFRYSQLRDDILPNDLYRWIWTEIDQQMEARSACKFIVGILSLSDKLDCEEKLGCYLKECILKKDIPSLLSIQNHFEPSISSKDKEIKPGQSEQHPLDSYNILIPCFSQEIH